MVVSLKVVQSASLMGGGAGWGVGVGAVDLVGGFVVEDVVRRFVGGRGGRRMRRGLSLVGRMRAILRGGAAAGGASGGSSGRLGLLMVVGC